MTSNRYSPSRSPLWPVSADHLLRFVPVPSTYSGKNDKALGSIIRQENIPGSRAARAELHRLRKPKGAR